MSSERNTETVYIASLFLEAITYGAHLICFCISSYVLSQRDHKNRRIYGVFAVSIAMFAVGTTHLAINGYRLISGYVLRNRDPVTGQLIISMIAPTFVAKNATYMIQTVLGDAFLVYRLYVTWNGLKSVYLPFVASLLACIVTGIQTYVSYIPSNWKYASGLLVPKTWDWLTAFFCLTLFTDLSCSLLIGARIWWIYRVERRASQLMRAGTIIVESGMIYSAFLALLLGFYFATSPARIAHKIILDSISQIIGIVFCLITIRVGYGVSIGDPQLSFKLDTLSYSQGRILTTTQNETLC